ncbi:hypothetical protein LR68_00144 [Anoxybacillus sp. BCO1]|nr:hypothetical protein LR68_00144 [Anoxybacillus sp. BCO1]
MIMWKRLLQSLYSPVHIARFRFHPIGKAISYVFFCRLLQRYRLPFTLQ